MNIHNPQSGDRLAPVRLDVEQRRRALATNGGIYGTRHLGEAEAILRARNAHLPLAAARRLAVTLPGARVWDVAMRRDVRDVLRGLAAAARDAGPRTEARVRSEWLRDRLRELEAQELRARTLAELLGVARPSRIIFPSPQPARRRR